MTAFAPSAKRRHHAAKRAGTTSTSGATRATTRSSTAILLVAVVAVLNVIGAVMVLSASSVSSLTDYGSPWFFFLRQLLWTAVGLGAFVFAIRFDYHNWQRLVRPLLIVSLILLVAVLLPGVGIYVSGARRWMGYGMFRIQPSEIAKLALLVYTADIVSRRGKELYDWRRVLRPVVLMLILFAALVMKEPDLGTTLVMAFLVIAVLVAGGVRDVDRDPGACGAGEVDVRGERVVVRVPDAGRGRRPCIHDAQERVRPVEQRLAGLLVADAVDDDDADAVRVERDRFAGRAGGRTQAGGCPTGRRPLLCSGQWPPAGHPVEVLADVGRTVGPTPEPADRHASAPVRARERDGPRDVARTLRACPATGN